MKQWRAAEECQGLDGFSGNGTKMNALSIKQAIKIHHQAVEKPEDYDLLADELNLDIALDAERLIM